MNDWGNEVISPRAMNETENQKLQRKKDGLLIKAPDY